MLYLLGKYFSDNFLRLFGSHVVLLSIGILAAGLGVWFFLPRYWDRLPHDHGKAFTPQGELSKGKPTGAGLIVSLVLLPILLLVVPPDWSVYGAIASLYGIMVCGFMDDASEVPWGQLKKGLLDLFFCLIAAYFVTKGRESVVWLPFTKQVFYAPAWLYIPVAAFVLFVSTNAMNCSDGVDGLAGTLGLISLLSLAALLYLVIGYLPVADYLLIPHNPESAKWAILVATIAGAVAGYLWFNCEPSSVLMGDAGSRMLGLAIGIAVLETGNPLFVIVVAPVVLVNGGTGMVKILILRFLKRLGIDTAPPSQVSEERLAKQPALVRGIHSVRFPLHDHCRKNLSWRNSQVLMRFTLLQSALIPLLFAIFTKIR